jgi:clan AA aspartic protease
VIGRIERLQPVLPVTFRLDDGRSVVIEFVVDTGYAGFLALPPAAVAALGLRSDFDLRVNLADVSEVIAPAYAARIVWNGLETDVRVLAMGRRPLLGTSLLHGCELVAQFAENGVVTVEAI